MTALPLYDGTFSTEAVAATALAVIDRLHAEAMTTIAALAEGGTRAPGTAQPAPPAEDDVPTTWSDPGSWSVDIEAEEAEGARELPLPPLPLLLRRPRATSAVDPIADAPVPVAQPVAA